MFDESVFPFASPATTVDVSTLVHAITFPSSEPATSDHVRNYDMPYLSTDVSPPDVSPLVQVSSSLLDTSPTYL